MVMAPSMRLETFDRGWLPLGKAKLIDWQHLDLNEAPQDATVWANAIKGESVLVRTWCEETDSHFDLTWLAYPSRTTHLAIQISRPEPEHLTLRLQLTAEAGHAAYDEAIEFSVHPNTGLQGRTARIVNGGTLIFDSSSFTLKSLSPSKPKSWRVHQEVRFTLTSASGSPSHWNKSTSSTRPNWIDQVAKKPPSSNHLL